MEDYAAKMLLKTDAALREYVTGHVQYREAAVLAAFDELRRRGQPAPEEAALRPALEEAAAAQRRLQEADEADRRQTALAADPEAAAAAGPALYSPVAIVLFSLFTMLIGAILMGINLYRLDKKRALVGLVVFVLAYAYAGRALVEWAIVQLGLNAIMAGLLFNIPAALVYVLWFWPRYVGNTVFRSRSVLVPILIYMLMAWSILKIIPYLPKAERQQFERMMPK